MSLPEGQIVPVSLDDIPGLLRARDIMIAAQSEIPKLLEAELQKLDALKKIAEAEGLRDVAALADLVASGV